MVSQKNESTKNMKNTPYNFKMAPQRFRVIHERMPNDQVPLRAIMFWWLGVIRIHEDGNVWSAVFRPWHPVTWMLFVVMIPVCAFLGERIFDIVPMRVGKYFQAHPKKLIWWTPFSKRQGLACRLHKDDNVKGIMDIP